MRKEGVLVLLALVFVSGFVLAEATSSDNETDINDFTSELADAFTCLETTAGDSCSYANDVTELSLIILASPDNIFSDCIDTLKQKVSTPSSLESKELAQAILALDHAGENISILENELLGRSKSSSSVDWIIQGVTSSEEDMSCTIKYGDEGNEYQFDISPKGKITETDSDKCFDLTYFDFWIQVDESCYGKEFIMNCGGDFKIPLLYKKSSGDGSDVYYILKDTQEGVAYQDLEFSVSSLCIVDDRNICDYEATLWGAYALRELGESIRDYMPYIVTSSKTYSTYFPEAFIPILDPNLNEKYREEILDRQKTDGSWHMSTYGELYDTALALFSYGISDETEKSERWLFTEQKDDGCWKDLSTTAMVLWALTQKAAPNGGGGSTYDCEDSGYFCLASAYCDSEDTLSSIYTGCSGASKVCCGVGITETCAELEGEFCEDGEVCSGSTRPAVDGNNCCAGIYSCVEEQQSGDTACELASSDNYCYSYNPQDTKSYQYIEQSSALSESCGEGNTCYKKVAKSSNDWIVWVLILLILGLITFLVLKYKDKLKGLFNKKNKGGANQPPSNQGRPPFPPSRPGMPPMRPPVGLQPRSIPNSGLQQGGVIRPAPPRRGMPPQNPI